MLQNWIKYEQKSFSKQADTNVSSIYISHTENTRWIYPEELISHQSSSLLFKY